MAGTPVPADYDPFAEDQPKAQGKPVPAGYDPFAVEPTDNRNWFMRAIDPQPPAQPPSWRETLGLDPSSESVLRPDAAQAAKAIADSATFGLAAKGLGYLNPQSLLPGDAPSYEGGVAAQRAELEKWQKENPGRALEAGLIGSALPGAAAGKAVGAGLRAADVTLKLPGQMALGSAGGALFGSASEAGHTDSDKWSDYGNAALKGAGEGPEVFGYKIPNYAIGAAAPVAGKVAGAIGEYAAPYLQPSAPGLGKGATGVLQGVAPADLEQRLAQLGPQGTLADTGPGMLGVAQGVRTNAVGTPIQGAIDQPLIQRAAAAPERLQADIHANLGVPQDPEALANHIKEYQDAVLGPKYEALWNANPPSVNIRPILNDIKQKLATAPTSVARALNLAHDELSDTIQGGGTIPKTSAQALHEAKGELGDKIEFGATGLDIPKGSKANGALKTVYGQLNDALKQQVPGYADVTAEAEKYFNLRRAVASGTETLGSETAWPETFKKSFDAMEPAEQQALREGMTASVGSGVGRNLNDLASLKRLVGGDLDWNRANMGTAFGPQVPQNMADAIAREQTFANTNQAVRQGSDTAARLAGAKNVEPSSQTFGSPTAYGDIKGLIRGLGNKAYEAIRGGYHGQKLNQLGDVITAPDSLYRQALVRALMAGRGASERAGQAIQGTVANPALISALMGGYQSRQ